MSDLLKFFIVCIWGFLVYKYQKNMTLILLFTLATILILCNINKVTEGYSTGSGFSDIYSNVDFKNVNSFDKDPKNSNNNNSNNNNSDNSNKNSNDVKKSGYEVKEVNGMNNIIVPMAPFTQYQMGPFDNLVLTTGNPKSEYVRLVDTGLSEKEDLCIYQGHENPLKCKKTIGLNMGPTVDGEEGSPKSLFPFTFNKSSPDCCPSTFSTSTGCVCTTENQRRFINRRGMGSVPKPAVSGEEGSPL